MRRDAGARKFMLPTGKWVIAPPRTTLAVGVADMVVSNDSNAEIVTYSLGSCLGVTVFDPVKKIGGLLHLMLPDSTIDPAKAAAMPFMFVDTGVPRLFHAAYNLGADRSRLVVKVAGGAQLLDQHGIFNIGSRNFEALKKLLAHNGLNLHAANVGGLTSRTLRLDLSNGSVTIKSPGENLYPL
jgi:chemotaxis protein CheD